MSRRPKSTRAEQFSAKVHGLKEIFKRLDRKLMPLPTGNDVANVLKYFEQTLMSLVKDMRPKLSEDGKTFISACYPSMDYAGLYTALTRMIKVVPNVELGVEAFAQSVLSIFASLLPFLSENQINSLPMTVASALMVWPHSIHQHVINLLGGYIIPMCLGVLVPKSGPFYAALNVPALIMTVLQFCPNPKQHAQFLEALMRVKRDVCSDLLAVLAFGPQMVLNPASQILLHYYPVTDIGGTDDWQFNYEPWHSKKCQVPDCQSPNNTARKICLDVTFASANCSMPPPVFLCNRCANQVDAETVHEGFVADIVEAVQAVSVTCDNEMCKSVDKTCISLCFAHSCIKDYRYHPLALCQECDSLAHGDGDEADKHVVQLRYPDPWGTENPIQQSYLIEAVVRLLQEAKPAQSTRYQDMGLDIDLKSQLPEFDDEVDNDVNNRRMLSRFSVWLLIGTCDSPTHCSSPETLGRLVSMVMDWMDAVSSLKRDYVGELLKTLANKHVKRWLTEVRGNKMSLFCACLSPSPPNYVRVAGFWNMLMNTVRQHMEGLHRLCRCISYDLINTEVWENIMPLWMEAIKSDVPPDDLGKFKTLLCNLFDPVLSPFRFSRENTLGFVKRALESAVPKQLFMALSWLQIISQLNLVVKPHVLLTMFIHCVQTYTECSEGIATMFPFPVYTGIEPLSPTMESPPTSVTSVSGDLKELNSTLSCFIMMLDLLVKQISIQFQREGRVLKAMEREDIKRLLKIMLDTPWGVNHESHTDVCKGCDMINLWFKLAFVLLDAVFPQSTAGFPEEVTLNAFAFGALIRSNQASRTASFKSTESRVSRQTAETIDEEVFSEEPQTPVSTSDTIVEGMSDMPEPECNGRSSQPDTPSEVSDLPIPFASLQSMTGSIGSWRSGASTSSWNTVFENYPQLQLLMGLLKEVPRQEDHNVQLNILKCLKVLVLRGDYLRVALMADVDFLAYLQEVFFIPNMWGLLKSEHSELSNLCVQVLLHNICLPFGSEKLCDEVEKACTDDDWRERFAAVEKITVLARFLEKENVKTTSMAMSALAHCFTYLVGAVEDVCTPVATRATTLLDTIKASSLKILYKCLEHQYDAVPRDRLLLIHTCRILHRVIPHYTPLCGQFFIRRFKHLLIENADFVSVGSPRAVGSPHGTPSVETPGDTTKDVAKRPAVLNMYSRSQSSKSFLAQSTKSASQVHNRSIANCTGRFRCNYNFKFAGDKPSYNSNLPGSVEGGNKSASGTRQRRTGGLSVQQPSPAAEIVDKMFLGGRIQKNLPTVIEEDASIDRDTASKKSSAGSVTSQTIMQEVGNMEAEATYQLVTLVMDFLAYPRGNKSAESVDVFVKTEKHEIVQMSHYLGVLMGYDIKVLEFTGDPQRLRSFPVFNAYLAGIAQVLDQNQEWGGELLNLTLQLLLFCAAPKAQKRIKTPKFTLVRLAQHTRHIWLTTCLIILYKYLFHHDTHKRDTRNLIHVVMNTLDAQDHDCPGPTPASEPFHVQTKEGNRGSRTSLSHLLDTPGEGSRAQERVGSPRLRRMVSDAGFTRPQEREQEDKCAGPSSRIVSSRESSLEEDIKRASLSIIHETPVVRSEVITSEAVIIETARVETVKTAVGSTKITRISIGEEKDLEPLVSDTCGKKPQKGDSDSKDSQGRTTSVEEQKPGSRPKFLAGSLSLKSMDKYIDGVQEKEGEPDDMTFDYCPECGVALEEFDEGTMNLCIVVLSTFVNQSPSMAMPLLPRVFQSVARKCVFPSLPWQNQSLVLVPGSNTEVAKQFFRCVLIKLAPHGVFSEVFRTVYKDSTLLKAIALSLNGFAAFDQMSPVAYLLQDVLGSRTLDDRVAALLTNLSTYLSFASKEPTSAWESQLSHFETFFRKLPKVLQDGFDITPGLKIMAHILDAANNSFKGLLPHFGQVVSYAINKGSFQLQDLLELCMKCTETFPKEHNKLFLTRTVVLEFVAAVKFKSWLPDANLQLLLQFLAVDAGSRIFFGTEGEDSQIKLPHGGCTRAMDCVQQHMTEAIEFIKDWHFVARSSNENRRLSEPNLNFETLPIHMKAGVAQLVALEITKHPKESKIYTKTLGWLKHPPSSTQLGRAELLDSVANIRLLAWLLQGSLSHLVNCRNSLINCRPVSFSENLHIADYVLIILFSFAEREPGKEYLNMTALYHAFNVCELWTLYCDHNKYPGESSTQSTSIIMEYWGKVTPGILHVLTHAKEVRNSQLCEHVSNKFLNLMEALQECNSTPLPKLYPMWYPILTFCFTKMTGASHARLRKAQSRKRIHKDSRTVLAKWLKQLQFKMALAEQSAPNAQSFVL